MTTLAIMNQIVLDIASDYDRLKEWETIYVAPTLVWPRQARQFELQVIDGGSSYSDFEGGVQREHFDIILALFTRTAFDYKEQHYRVLQDISSSIFIFAAAIHAIIEGSLLTGELLTRPFRIHTSHPIATNSRFPDLMVKRLVFRGGLNATR